MTVRNTFRVLAFWLVCRASACPVCHTEAGDQVRAALFGPDLWFNAAATVLPFSVLVAVTAWIYFGTPRFK